MLNNQGNNAISTKANELAMHPTYLNPQNSIFTNDSVVNFMIHEDVIACEASHIYLKSFRKQYNEQLEQIKSIFLTTTKGEKLKENQWENEFEALFVRTCVVKILEKKYGNEKGKVEIDNQAKHFKLAASFYTIFDQYMDTRLKYPNITAFYPKITGYLLEMARVNTSSLPLSE